MCYNVLLLLSIFSIFNTEAGAEVTAKQYASIPELFHQDNYDRCMMLEDEAFYCGITYEVAPIDEENPSDIWRIVKNLSEISTNYRHDHIRHWICVPKACPGINITDENDPLLRDALKKCYDKKYEVVGLKGIITRVKCETVNPKHPVDWLDIFVGFFFLSYIMFVMYATCYEGIARYKPPEEYARRMSTPTGKVLFAFSITRNWIRLKTINSTPEIEKLRPIQGVRVYNTALVIMCHTLLAIISAPITNTKEAEQMHENNSRLFFSSGPLCVTTFFFISYLLLSNGLFEYMKENKMNMKVVFTVFANRVFRLTPPVFVIVLFHATLLRHLGNGPNWNHYIGQEFRKCRMNGWTNLLYINNWKDPYNMCLPITWYLAVDTQLFILCIFFIWFLKTYEKHIWYIIAAAISLNIVGTFIHNYYYDFTALVLPTPEMYYGMDNLFNSFEFHYQLGSIIGNAGGPLVGIAVGYYFFKYKNAETHFFNTKFRVTLWWILTYGFGFGFVIFPGLIILNVATEHNAFWASVYVAVSRPLFATVIGIGFIGSLDGVGWLTNRICCWGPTYVLGRLTFSAYLIHMSVGLLRPALARSPLYFSDFQMLIGFFGDICIVYIAATLMTLFIELPVSQLQKYIFVQKSATEESTDKKRKDM